MATIELYVPDESLVSKIKQVCKMLQGVTLVKVRKTETPDITKTSGYREAMEDIKEGRLYHADSTEDMFKQIQG